MRYDSEIHHPRSPRRRLSAGAPWLILALALSIACRPEAPTAEHRPEASQSQTGELTAELQALVDSAVADNESIPGAAIYVAAPDFEFEGAAGLADPETGVVMTPAHPVRIASNTKTYVAATVLRLAEEGKLELVDPIAEHLSPALVETLLEDGYDPEAITVRHLLTHTAGVFDHSDTPNYIEAITAEPDHDWTRAEQVEAAMDWGDPLGQPGELYRYSDTGYVLLGDIVSNASGKSLPPAVRELLELDSLGLRSTWWETLEPRPRGVPERAHQFFGESDTFEFDPSLDLYGGGGLVATVGDLGRFLRALFKGDIFADSTTRAIMLSTVEGATASGEEGQMPPGMYRMGIWVLDVGGYETYRHSGFWGTVADYVPELDLVVACTVNQNRGGEILYELAEKAIVLAAKQLDAEAS